MLLELMNVRYDSESDIAYIELSDSEYSHSVKVDKNVLLELGKDGSLIGVELWNVKQRDPKMLEKLKARS
jgi:uncharacterized protein YuzE